MSAPLAPDAFEERLGRFLFERAEESRAVRVGEKETSEQAQILARYEDLFDRDQLALLRAAEEDATEVERERLYRLRATCESGIISAELAERDDALENALLAERIEWQGAEIPLRTAQALLATTPAYADRDRLGACQLAASARFNDERLGLLAAHEALAAELSREPDPVRRSDDEKQISLLGARCCTRRRRRAARRPRSTRLRTTLVRAPAGPGPRDRAHVGAHGMDAPALPARRRRIPKEPMCAGVRRRPCTRLGFDIEGERGIKLDLEDRPQKSPRACVIASDPPRLVHLITRAQGGLHDYEAFLHEAGHALHYAGCDPDLAPAFRRIARDHALTEIYSFLLDSIVPRARLARAAVRAQRGAGARACRGNGVSRRTALPSLHRQSSASSSILVGFGADGGTPGGYEERLTAATGIRYPAEGFLADMDAGFYSADYLRAWVRSAQLRRHLQTTVGPDWWQRRETGDFLRGPFREGTRPSSEEIASESASTRSTPSRWRPSCRG